MTSLLASDLDTAKALLTPGSAIPVVFVNVADPVGAGLVPALDQPGGNITGVCQRPRWSSTQWPEMLRRIAPNVMRMAILHDPSTSPTRDQIAAIQTVAPAVGVGGVRRSMRKSFRELDGAITGFSRTPNGGLIVGMSRCRRATSAIVQLAARLKLPAIYADRHVCDARAGSSRTGPTSRSSTGSRPTTRIASSRARSRPTCRCSTSAKFDMVINLKTAKALGLNVPLPLLGRADEVIE